MWLEAVVREKLARLLGKSLSRIGSDSDVGAPTFFNNSLRYRRQRTEQSPLCRHSRVLENSNDLA